MIILFHPRATKPRNRRLPLAVLALAAVLEGKEEYEIVDGNLEEDATGRIADLIATHHVELLGVSAMPGPQMVAAMETSRAIRERHPEVPICWGGYFPSIYPDAALNARYVDYVVRGQGEDTLLELLDALRGNRPFDSIKGLLYKDVFGMRRDNGERPMKGPDEFPWSPFHRLPVGQYLRPSFFGKRTAVHHASIGCPFNCSFCGVHAAYGNKEKFESPERTVEILTHLVNRYGADSVQFYDMNFFLREDLARELCDRMAHLNLRWWCEARVDIMSRYSDETWAAIKRAGCAMIFFGAESGSDWVLEEMQKGITTAQTLEIAHRTRQFGIIPEFSFVIGNPNDPDRDTRETLRFIRKIKRINPDSEIIIQHYTPTPQPHKAGGEMYGNIEVPFPDTPAGWATPEWMNYTLRIDTNAPWLKRKTKQLIDNFEIVVASRWPTVQDTQLCATVNAARGIGLDSISFLPADLTSAAFNRDQPWTEGRQNEVALDVAELAALEAEIEALIATHHDDIRGRFIQESEAKLRHIVTRFGEHIEGTAPMAPLCNAPWVSTVMEVDGTIRPCFFHPPVASTATQTLEQALNSAAARSFRSELEVASNPVCQRCVCSLNYRPAAQLHTTKSKRQLV